MRLRGVGVACLALTATSAVALDEVNIRSVGIQNEDRRTELEDSLRSASLLNTALEEETENTQDILGSAASDYARLLSVLYAQGYYEPTISIKLDGREAAQIDPFSPPDAVTRADVAITTGPRFSFGQTQIAPRAPTATQDPVVEGFQRGEIARSTLIGDAANAGVREWRETGHAKADVADQSIVADHRNKNLDVDIALAPGPRLKFGTLAVNGETRVRKSRIRAIMGFPSGEYYSPEAIRETVARLRRTGAFSVATLKEADSPNPDGTLDYTLSVIDEKPRRFGFSGEYSTIEGFTVATYWLHRNILGGAQRLRIDAAAANIGGTQQKGFEGGSGVDYSLGARLTRPATLGPDNDSFVFSDFEVTDDEDFKETAFSVGLGFTRYFSDTLKGEVAAALRYSDVSDDFGDREFYLVTLPSSLEWDRRDNPGDATRGTYLDVELTPYIGFNGSKSGAVADIDARGYKGFGEEDGLVLAGRVQIGSVVGSDFEDTPPSYLFYSGGGDTVRGQKYQSLGVDRGDGRESGGRSFLGLSGEVRGSITDQIGLVGFIDAGFIGPDSYVTEEGHWQSGVGAGVRYDTPIGPLRVDIATPYTGEAEEFSAVELYIGVGQAF